ncbi:tRNA 2-thiocytidine biosynthesis TtcA family protein [Prevotella sp.]|uniref:tRNA 2-thiocytidine biosynthesis TtcA family protein n=1 Tax=Prevotella sp. TaxID=59823 RepID=UPI0025CCCCDC|nr:tRNA 2-thiocytidine biosynthesis TtcA family protein [Prevotella sp.]
MRTRKQILNHLLYKQFQKALTDYSMLADGDRILVGLSGGKDSLCLLEMLARRQRIFKPQIEVEAVHVRMKNIHYESDTSYLERFANEHGVRLHFITTEFDDTNKTDKPACFLCSWHRRKALFRFAQDFNFNKIALGHHMDDIIHTAMLNQFFQGSFSTMPAVMQMTKMPLTIIRPLCLVKESDIKEYAYLCSYEKQLKNCPYEKVSNRTDMRRVFEEIERINPEARYSIWHALEKEGKIVCKSNTYSLAK